MGQEAMSTQANPTEETEAEVDATMDGGLCRLDVPGPTEIDEDEVAAPQDARRGDKQD